MWKFVFNFIKSRYQVPKLKEEHSKPPKRSTKKTIKSFNFSLFEMRFFFGKYVFKFSAPRFNSLCKKKPLKIHHIPMYEKICAPF